MMLFNEELVNKLPDDIIDYIYKKIYYKHNDELLEEIKLMYYINKKLIKYENLKDVCSCALIHMKDDIFIERIKIEDINNINDYIRDLNINEVKILTNKTLSKAPLKKKYSFIFYMTDVTIHGKNYINDDFIKHYVNYLVKNLID